MTLNAPPSNQVRHQVELTLADKLSDDNDCLAYLRQVLAVDPSVVKLVFGGAGCLPPHFQDRERFVGLVKLIVDKMGMANELTLFAARDFARAEVDMDYSFKMSEDLLRYKRRDHLITRIQAGLRQEGVAEHEIKAQTRVLILQYSDIRTRRDVTSRFGIPDIDALDAKITRDDFADFARFDQAMSQRKRQRDLALKSVETCNRLAAGSLRETARTNDRARAQMGAGDIDPAARSSPK